MELQQLFEQFLSAKRAQGLRERTIEWYAYQLDMYYRWLLESGQRDITQRVTIEAYLNARQAMGLAPESIMGAYRGLKVFYRWLVDAGHLAESPVDAIKRRKPPVKPKRQVDIEDYARLIRSIPPTTWVDLRDRLLVDTLFLCGLRLGEVVRLQASNYNVVTKLLTVPGGKTGARVVPMLSSVIESFIAYCYERPAGPPQLFLSAHGDLSVRGVITDDGVRDVLVRRCAAAGVEYMNPHAFRHGIAMYLLNKGGDMSLVQRVLGHSRIATTAEHYARWLTDDLSREFTEIMNR